MPPANAQLAAFLAEHHLTDGVSGYWLSSIVTVGSDGAVTVRAVQPSLRPYLWEAKGSWYDPGCTARPSWSPTASPASSTTGNPARPALAAYGPPAHTYHVGPYTVLVWDKNLLAGPG